MSGIRTKFRLALIPPKKPLHVVWAYDPRLIANPGKMFPGTEAPALKQHGLHPLEEAGVISRE